MAHVLRVSPEAADLLLTFERWIEPQLAEFESLSRMSDWAGKLAGAVARLASVMHLYEHANEPQP
jgi:hypothetical protein